MKKAGGASPSPTKMPLPNGEVAPKVTERGIVRKARPLTRYAGASPLGRGGTEGDGEGKPFDKHALSPATRELSRRESLLK